jgi:YD repeat-containing protein
MADDRAKWEVHGPVASLKKEHAEWDLEQQYWKPALHFTVTSFRPDGAITSTDGYNPDGSIAQSRWIYDFSGRLIECNSRMNDEARQRTLYFYEEDGRHARCLSVADDGTETDAEVYSYDAEGKRTKVSPLAFRDGHISYGIEGTDISLGAPGATRMVTTYDEHDLPVRVIFENGNQKTVREVILKRDNEGRLVHLETRMGAQPSFSCGGQLVSAEADAAVSLLMQALQGTLTIATFAYDDQGRLLERTSSMFNLGGDRTTYRYGDGDDPIEEICEHTSREANLDDSGALHPGSDHYTAHPVRISLRHAWQLGRKDGVDEV